MSASVVAFALTHARKRFWRFPVALPIAELLFRVVLHLLQNHGRDFLGRVLLAVDVDDRTAVLAGFFFFLQKASP